MERLNAFVQKYHWGDPAFIPSLQGRQEMGEPEAELWIGTHQKSPSMVMGTNRTLTEIIDSDPQSALGDHIHQTHGELQYLVKVLAINTPLSLQAHPTAAQAEAGYEEENNKQIPLHSPNRIFSAPDEKSEIVCALTSFEARFGFRTPDESLSILSQISHPNLDDFTIQLGHNGADSERLRQVVEWLLAQPPENVESLIQAVAENSGQLSELKSFAQLAGAYPNDPAVMISLLLNHVELRQGDALYVPPGTAHSYLSGCAVEVTSNSDNVIRAGLTTKPVNPDAFCSIVGFSPIDPKIQSASIPEAVYDSYGAGFSLSRLELDGEWTTKLDGPEILISTDGPFTITNWQLESLNVSQGAPVWVPYSDVRYTLSGKALIFRGITTKAEQ
ncbi:MAG: mannose-6-phosphate isomerase, class I [Actinomycetota bacterium]|nr:mannose-6-phosphate isomerase, class I [Actinomycetota bacterium]